MTDRVFEIAKPCDEVWDDMRPTSRGRYCDACRKQVHDISELTEAEARELVGGGTEICISYLVDRVGTIQFQRPDSTASEPTPALVPVARLARRASVAARLAPAAGIAMALAACAPHQEPDALRLEAAPAASVSPRASAEIPDAPDEPCEPPPMAEPEPEPEPEAEAQAERKAPPWLHRVKGGKPARPPEPLRLVGVGM